MKSETKLCKTWFRHEELEPRKNIYVQLTNFFKVNNNFSVHNEKNYETHLWGQQRNIAKICLVLREGNFISTLKEILQNYTLET